MVDIISQGSLERFKILKEFNFWYLKRLGAKALDRLCTVTTSPGGSGGSRLFGEKHELVLSILEAVLK